MNKNAINCTYLIDILLGGIMLMFAPKQNRPDRREDVLSACQVYTVMIDVCKGGAVSMGKWPRFKVDDSVPSLCVYFFEAAGAFSILTSSTVKIRVE